MVVEPILLLPLFPWCFEGRGERRGEGVRRPLRGGDDEGDEDEQCCLLLGERYISSGMEKEKAEAPVGVVGVAV